MYVVTQEGIRSARTLYCDLRVYFTYSCNNEVNGELQQLRHRATLDLWGCVTHAFPSWIGGPRFTARTLLI